MKTPSIPARLSPLPPKGPSLALALTLALTSCGGGTVAEEPDPQKENPFIVDQYLDYELKTSADLTKGAFISGRNLKGKDTKTKKGKAKIAQNTKIYKVDLSGTTPNPTRATNADIGSEQQVALSGDGKWIAILARKGGQKKLYVQSYADASKRVEITRHDSAAEDIFEITFSRRSNPYALAYLTRPKAAGGKKQVHLVAIKDADGTDDGSFKIEVPNAAAIMFGEAEGTTGNYDLIVKNATTAASGETSYTFSRYPIGGVVNGGSASADATTDAKLTQLASSMAVAQGSGLYLIESLNRGQDSTPVTPIGDSTNKPSLENLGNAFTLNVAPGSTKTILSSKITNPVAISALYDKSAVVLLGEEAIDCHDIGRFNTTSMAFKSSGDFKRLYITETAANQFGIQLLDHSCDLKRQEAKINDRLFREAVLKKAADGFYHLFVQSSYFGDIEIYRFKFKEAGGAITETSFLNISDNRKP